MKKFDNVHRVTFQVFKISNGQMSDKNLEELMLPHTS